MHNIYRGRHFFLLCGASVLTSSKGPKMELGASARRGSTVPIKSATLAGQLCIEVAYLGTVMALWEQKNNSPQTVGST